jgi:hypothetical protein
MSYTPFLSSCYGTLVRVAIGDSTCNYWMTLADPKFISLTTIQFGKKIKDKKERFFLDPRVTNVQRLHPEGINKKA